MTSPPIVRTEQIQTRLLQAAICTFLTVNPVPDFLQPLQSLTQPFPREAVAEAIARREETIPHLLDALVWVTEHPDEANDAEPCYMLHLFALFLLAQFREVQAYPFVIQLARHPDLYDLIGDSITADLGQILASVCGGDTGPIEQLIEDPAVDEYVRSAGVTALGVLLHTGAKTWAEISAYVGELLAHRLDRAHSYAWDSTVALCTDFGMGEHLEAIREGYRLGFCDATVDLLPDVEEELARPPLTSPRTRWNQYTLIDDAIAEMENWPCFKTPAQIEEGEKMWALRREAALQRYAEVLSPAPAPLRAPSTPTVRETPKIGRNDQCPCGSGKKYKKCCGREAAA